MSVVGRQRSLLQWSVACACAQERACEESHVILVAGGLAPNEHVDEDDRKLHFTLEALASRDPFALEAGVVCWVCGVVACAPSWQMEVSQDLEDALRWQADRTPEEIMIWREATLQSLEAAGAVMWEKGWCSQWLSGADASVAKVAATVNGPMLQDLCQATFYGDSECVNLFRQGLTRAGGCEDVALHLCGGGRGRPVWAVAQVRHRTEQRVRTSELHRRVAGSCW